MNADCSICEDVFTGSDGEVVHSTLCGHLFHLTCLSEWLRRSKTCPQCRSYVNECQTVKLYFQVSTGQSIQAPRILEKEIATLKRLVMLQKCDLHGLAQEKHEAVREAESWRTSTYARDVIIKEYEKKVNDSQVQVSALLRKISLQDSEIMKLNCQKMEVQAELDNLRNTLRKRDEEVESQEIKMLALQRRVNLLDHQIRTLKIAQLEISDLRRRVQRYEKMNAGKSASNRAVKKPKLRILEDKTDTLTSSGLVENPLMILGDERVDSALRFLGDEEADNTLMLLGKADIFKDLGVRLEGTEDDKKSMNEDDDSVITLSDDDDNDSVTALDVIKVSKKSKTTKNAPVKRKKSSQSDDDDSVILVSDDETDNSFGVLGIEEISQNLETCGHVLNKDRKSPFQYEADNSSVLFNDEEVNDSLVVLNNDDVLKHFDICQDLSVEHHNSVISNASLMSL